LIKESTSNVDRYLEYPQYTRPENFRNLKVPEVLLSGNHKKYKHGRQNKLKTKLFLGRIIKILTQVSRPFIKILFISQTKQVSAWSENVNLRRKIIHLCLLSFLLPP